MNDQTISFLDLTRQYHEYSSLKSNAHFRAAEHHRKKHLYLGSVTIGATAIVGTSVFTSLQESHQSWIQLATGFLAVLAVVLSSLHTFLGFGDRSTNHKSAATGYGAIRRDIEILVLKYPGSIGAPDEPATQGLEEIKKSLDKLDEESPTIKDSDWEYACKNFDYSSGSNKWLQPTSQKAGAEP